jgi:hypothetical protein
MAATAGLSLTLDPKKKIFQNTSSLKPLGQFKTKLPKNDHCNVPYKIFVHADRKSKMAATAGHRLTLDTMGKCSNAFFSETINQTESNLPKNDYWKVLYKL